MSKKQFTTDYSDLLKNDKTFIKKGNERLTYEEIVDLLNEQQSTISQLEGKVKRLNAFLVEQGLAEEYILWNKKGIYDE